MRVQAITVFTVNTAAHNALSWTSTRMNLGSFHVDGSAWARV